VREGRINGVIDWGSMGVGDPACDVMVAWKFHSATARDAFRQALSTDDATWSGHAAGRYRTRSRRSPTTRPRPIRSCTTRRSTGSKVVQSERDAGERHSLIPRRGWSVYGAERSQLVATGGKWSGRENSSNRRKPLPWVATDGKEGVDGSSSSEGLAPAKGLRHERGLRA